MVGTHCVFMRMRVRFVYAPSSSIENENGKEEVEDGEVADGMGHCVNVLLL